MGVKTLLLFALSQGQSPWRVPGRLYASAALGMIPAAGVWFLEAVHLVSRGIDAAEPSIHDGLIVPKLQPQFEVNALHQQGQSAHCRSSSLVVVGCTNHRRVSKVDRRWSVG